MANGNAVISESSVIAQVKKEIEREGGHTGIDLRKRGGCDEAAESGGEYLLARVTRIIIAARRDVGGPCTTDETRDEQKAI
jgi:hypothetical protein